MLLFHFLAHDTPFGLVGAKLIELANFYLQLVVIVPLPESASKFISFPTQFGISRDRSEAEIEKYWPPSSLPSPFIGISHLVEATVMGIVGFGL